MEFNNIKLLKKCLQALRTYWILKFTTKTNILTNLKCKPYENEIAVIMKIQTEHRTVKISPGTM